MSEENKELPRLWRKRPLVPGVPFLGRVREFIYGCYFASSDLNVNEGGGRGTGKPTDVEWLDEIPEQPGRS